MSNNLMKIQMGEGVFEQAVLEIQVGGGGRDGSKNRAFRRGAVDFF